MNKYNFKQKNFTNIQLILWKLNFKPMHKYFKYIKKKQTIIDRKWIINKYIFK